MSLSSAVAALATRVASEFGTVRGEVTTGLSGKANTSHTHAAVDVNSGTLAVARVPTGTTSTTVALGNHTHSYQAADSDLSDIAGLTHANDTFLQTKSGVWAARTPAQVVTDLAGTSSTTLAAGNRGQPTGGATGNVLTKNSSTDYDASYAPQAGLVIARGRRTTSATAVSSTAQASAQKVLELPASLKANRLYRVSVEACQLFGSAAGTCIVAFTYTTAAGTPATPTVTGTLLHNVPFQVASGVIATHFNLVGYHAPGASDLNIKVLLCYWAATAATYTMAPSANAPLNMMIEDVGVDPGTTGTAF